ncbi:hypothetical protein PENSPDRAFT_235106 [Peniophora sp. CONT]|nr:hypothetical protein PENSPDRAFT_235106 [Peniophora sp. CONT]
MSQPTQSITVSISLNPPENTIVPTSLSSTSSHRFPLSIAPDAQDHAGYYAALRAALADARTKTGDELTQWRDAVGKNELGKEPKKNVTDEDEEEDEEDEDEGE